MGHHISTPTACSAILYALCIWSLLIRPLVGCPSTCECKYRDGKDTVICRDVNFLDIPRVLEPTTQVLDIRQNDLKMLPKDFFWHFGLVRLEEVQVSHCNLVKVEKGAFKNLASVFHLDLRNNLLTSVPTSALGEIGGLKELFLAYNSIKFISSTSFLPTPELVELDISHNDIFAIEAGALRHLQNLEVLNLSENKLITLEASELLPLTHLRIFNIDGNLWHCDCHLKSLHKWLSGSELKPFPPPVCSQPKWLFGKKWQRLDSDDFICSPKALADSVEVLATEGENVTLPCRVESEVPVSITWLVGDNRIHNTNESLRFYISELTIANNTIYASTLTVTGVQLQDQDSYHCLAENRAGYSEVHVSLRVSHDLAEVHAADVEPTSYMNIVLILGGLGMILFLLILFNLVYGRILIGLTAQQGNENCDVPQAARTSEEEIQIFDGYHMNPTGELEDISQRLHSFQHSRLSSRAERWDNTNQSLSEHDVGYSQEHPVINVSNVDIPLSGEEAAKTLEDQAHNTDDIIHATDGRIPSIHICHSTLEWYEGDMNFPQFDGQENSSALHTLNSSYCASPIRRSKNTSDTTGKSCVRPWQSDSVHHPCNLEYRSYSELNLALSEASFNAYGNSQIAAHPVLLVGSTTQTQNHSSMQDLMIYQE